MTLRAAVFLLLLVPAGIAQSAKRIEDLAQQFAEACRLEDQARQTLLAAYPAGEVPYALVVERLLYGREPEAAAALAKLRGATGPEGAALLRIVESFQNGLFPRPAQLEAWQQAVRLLQSRRPVEALAALESAGEPIAGTCFGARLSWTRARALARAGQSAEAAAELARSAELARAVGWLAMVLQAEETRVLRTRDLDDRLRAAEGFVDAARKLDDWRRLLQALKIRAATRIAKSGRLQAAGKADAASKLSQQGREDYRGVIDLAERMGNRLEAALAWRDLALVVALREGQPRQAIELYQKSIEILRGLRKLKHLDDVLLNTAIALTSVARYDEALEMLGEILRRGDALKGRALAQRAYVLGRMRRLEKAVKAYAAALAATDAGPASARLHIDAGNLQILRGDLRAAEAHFRKALAAAPDAPGAWVGRASVRGLRGFQKGAAVAFREALAREKSPASRATWLMIQAAQQRGWGQIDDASRTARRALEILLDPKLREFAKAGAAWLVLADLKLLQGDYAEGQQLLAKAGVFFFRLKDPYRAIDIYAQETLVLIMLKKMGDALERLQTLLRMASATPSDALKSVAKSTEAIFEARAGRLDKARHALDEAEKLAARAGDRLREATALTNRALIEPDRALESVGRALTLLDARRLDGPEEHPLIEGHRPDQACSIALAALLEGEARPAGEAFRLIERSRAERILIALRGREAVLEATLPERLHKAYVAARGRLVEAQVEKKGVAEAEKAFDGTVARIRAEAPAAAALAWPRPPALQAVQKALRADEAILVLLLDGYVRVALCIDAEQAVLHKLEGKVSDMLSPFEKQLRGKRKLMIAPHGTFLREPFELLPYGPGTVGDAFEVYYVPSAAWFLRQRARRQEKGRGLWAVGKGPARFPEPLNTFPPRRKALLHVGLPARIDGAHPQTTRVGDENALRILRRRYRADVVVLPETESVAGARFEGAGALVEALAYAGAGGIVLSPHGPAAPAQIDRFYRDCIDEKLPPGAAVREVRAWAKAQARDAAARRDGAGLVYWGIPE